MTTENLHDIFVANPTTTMSNTDIMYLIRSPYGGSDDFAITWANIIAAIAAALPGGTQVVVVTTATQAMSPNTVYIVNRPAGLVTLTLPAITSPGDMMKVVGFSASGWTVQCGVAQEVHFGTDSPSVGGTISSTSQHDSIELITAVANTDFVLTNLIGNLTFT